MGNPTTGPQRPDDLDGFDQPTARGPGVHAEAFVLAVSCAQSQDDPASRELVQGGHLFGDVDGVSQGPDVHPRTQLHFPGHRNRASQQRQRLLGLQARLMAGEQSEECAAQDQVARLTFLARSSSGTASVSGVIL